MQNRSHSIKINDTFTCIHCQKKVKPHPAGGCRNHCPFCLYSVHVDGEVPGDRAGDCGGMMAPLRAQADPHKSAILDFQCLLCGKKARNRVAQDDDWEKICQLSRVPL